MKDLFGEEFEVSSQKYAVKVETPIYEPKRVKPIVYELYDTSKTDRLIRRIKEADIDDGTKAFLIESAHRHTKFNYSRIADFYANSPKEVQQLMEDSALVIVDYDKAIEKGFVKLQSGLKTIIDLSKNK